MTLNVELSPDEERRLAAVASRSGMAPALLARKLLSERLSQVAAQDAEVEANSASVQLLESWLREGTTNDPTEIAEAERDLAAFKEAMDAERERAGSRKLYP